MIILSKEQVLQLHINLIKATGSEIFETIFIKEAT